MGEKNLTKDTMKQLQNTVNKTTIKPDLAYNRNKQKAFLFENLS